MKSRPPRRQVADVPKLAGLSEEAELAQRNSTEGSRKAARFSGKYGAICPAGKISADFLKVHEGQGRPPHPGGARVATPPSAARLQRGPAAARGSRHPLEATASGRLAGSGRPGGALAAGPRAIMARTPRHRRGHGGREVRRDAGVKPVTVAASTSPLGKSGPGELDIERLVEYENADARVRERAGHLKPQNSTEALTGHRRDQIPALVIDEVATGEVGFRHPEEAAQWSDQITP